MQFVQQTINTKNIRTGMPSVLWCCWLGSRNSIWPVKTEWWGAGVVICLECSWCHCHSLSLASVKSRFVIPFWYQLTRVVSDKGPLRLCVCVYVQAILTSTISYTIWLRLWNGQRHITENNTNHRVVLRLWLNRKITTVNQRPQPLTWLSIRAKDLG